MTTQLTQTVCIFGAAGKMGTRISNALHDEPAYTLLHVEADGVGQDQLRARGDEVVMAKQALPEADIVILAVPDRLIGVVAEQATPAMKPGAMLMGLDPAAPWAGQIPHRDDVSVFVTHPCHPSVFNEETDMDARFDYFGSGLAKQSIVCALMRGPEADYDRGEQLARAMWKPVLRSHRITVEQMALLEPALSETLAATCIAVVREGMDEAVKRGVPEQAARDFLLGHLFVEIAILFDRTDFPFSDGAKQAIAEAKPLLFKSDWKRIFEPEQVTASVKRIANV